MDKAQAFKQLVADIKNHHCTLRATCIQPVPGDGNPTSSVVFIGEAPGRNEDQQGRPFVGAAGKLLDSALATIGWSRANIYITNIVKCRPPGNRDPLPEEVAEHRVFLERELALIQPTLIVLLGRHALHWFLPGEQISQVHGQVRRNQDAIYLPIYHPAAALYNPKLKDSIISDIQQIPLILQKIVSPAPAQANAGEQHSILDQTYYFPS